VLRLLFAAGWMALAAPPAWSSGWVDEQQLGVYSFHAEFPLRDIADLVQDLGELQKDIESTLELKCSDRPIHVYLFRSSLSYSRAIRQLVPGSGNRRAMFVAGNDFGRVFAYRHRDLATDLRHETTHALLHNALPYVPLWLDEGLAEYFEAPVLLRVDGHAHRRALKTVVWLGNKPNLAELEAKRDLEKFTAADYRDAWGWVNFMLHGPPEARAALQEYLATIPTGREPTPLSLTLQRRLPDLDRRIVQHLR
jgi:hypothetical protein